MNPNCVSWLQAVRCLSQRPSTAWPWICIGSPRCLSTLPSPEPRERLILSSENGRKMWLFFIFQNCNRVFWCFLWWFSWVHGSSHPVDSIPARKWSNKCERSPKAPVEHQALNLVGFIGLALEFPGTDGFGTSCFWQNVCLSSWYTCKTMPKCGFVLKHGALSS